MLRLDPLEMTELRAKNDALRALVQQAIETIDSYGEIGTPLAALAEHLEVRLATLGGPPPPPGAELAAARALLAAQQRIIADQARMLGRCEEAFRIILRATSAAQCHRTARRMRRELEQQTKVSANGNE